MENQNSRADRQKLVRETLDRQTERLNTSGPKTRAAYWLFAAVVVAGIAFAATAAEANPYPAACEALSRQMVNETLAQTKGTEKGQALRQAIAAYGGKEGYIAASLIDGQARGTLNEADCAATLSQGPVAVRYIVRQGLEAGR